MLDLTLLEARGFPEASEWGKQQGQAQHTRRDSVRSWMLAMSLFRHLVMGADRRYTSLPAAAAQHLASPSASCNGLLPTYIALSPVGPLCLPIRYIHTDGIPHHRVGDVIYIPR